MVTYPTEEELRRVARVDLSSTVLKALYEANTILYASEAEVPVALAVGASAVVGRKASGGIAALTGTELMALLSGKAGAPFDFNGQEVTGATIKAGGVITAGNFGGIHITGYADAEYALGIRGGLTGGAVLVLYGKSHASQPGLFILETTNAAGNQAQRLTITGGVNEAVMALLGTTVSGLDITFGQVVKVAGVQVVAARVVDARIDNEFDAEFETSNPDTAGLIDSMRDAMLAHGLMAAS